MGEGGGKWGGDTPKPQPWRSKLVSGAEVCLPALSAPLSPPPQFLMSTNSLTTCCESGGRTLAETGAAASAQTPVYCPVYESRLLATARHELNSAAALGVYGGPYAGPQGYGNYVTYGTEAPAFYSLVSPLPPPPFPVPLLPARIPPASPVPPPPPGPGDAEGEEPARTMAAGPPVAGSHRGALPSQPLRPPPLLFLLPLPASQHRPEFTSLRTLPRRGGPGPGRGGMSPSPRAGGRRGLRAAARCLFAEQFGGEGRQRLCACGHRPGGCLLPL